MCNIIRNISSRRMDDNRQLTACVYIEDGLLNLSACLLSYRINNYRLPKIDDSNKLEILSFTYRNE